MLKIGNKVLKEDIFVNIVFSTKLQNEKIKYDKNEILDVKWFTYEEIVNMKEELRDYDWIINCISNYIENEIVNIDLIKIM